jgi:tetratricopeptide (TPR) repeat protein
MFSHLIGGKETDKSYLLLFEILCESETYDESKVKKQLGIKSDTAFKKLKGYTISMILRSLENFHSGNQDLYVLLRSIQQAEILYQKKLFSLAEKSIEKALDIARRKDLIQYVYACIEFKYRMASASGKPFQALEAINPDEVAKTGNDTVHWMKFRRWHLDIINENKILEGKVAIRLNEIIEETKKFLESNETGFTLFKETASMLSVSYRLIKDWDNCIYWRKQCVVRLENEPDLLLERAAEYIVTLSNLLNVYNDTGNNKEIEKVFEKANKFINEIPKAIFDPRIEERVIAINSNYSTYLFKTGQYEACIEKANQLLKLMQKHNDTFQNSNAPTLYKNLIVSHFYLKKYRDALRLFNTWYYVGRENVVEKKMFELILFYELKESDLLLNKVRSLVYQMKKQVIQTKLETILVKLFSELVKHANDAEKEKIAFINASDNLRKTSITDKELHFFDFPSWVYSKTS